MAKDGERKPLKSSLLQKGGDKKGGDKTRSFKRRVQLFKNFPFSNFVDGRPEKSGRMPRCGRILPSLAACLTAFFLTTTAIADSPPSSSLNWPAVAKPKPSLRVLILVTSSRPFTLSDLATLADHGFRPADRDAGMILGLNRAVFKGSLRNWVGGPPLPSHVRGQVLQKFVMRGIYRVGFRVEEKDYRGPLNLEITAPREGFGQELLSAENLVRPERQSSIRLDSAGNRWLCVEFPEVRAGQMIHLHFGFKYLVDMEEMLHHDLSLAGEPQQEELPQNVLAFLKGGFKIDPALPEAVTWAEAGNPGPPDARREFARLSKDLAKKIVYDKRKRQEYFGGQSLYSNLDQMYQEPSVTLSRGIGACPDTVLMECSFLRARGIPCRTAGRFGHFFSVVYLRGRGWMSTSVIPTAIPLILAPGPDHLSYQKWTPNLLLRTTRWEAAFEIEPLEESP